MEWFYSKTYKRLNKIYKYCKEFYEKQTHKCSDDYIINFNSALGEVEVIIKKFYTASYDIGLIYKNKGKVIFEIYADCLKLTTNPLLNDDLGGHDIDLAILELEEYLNIQYGDINKIIKQKEKRYKDAIKRHKRELKVLEENV